MIFKGEFEFKNNPELMWFITYTDGDEAEKFHNWIEQDVLEDHFGGAKDGKVSDVLKAALLDHIGEIMKLTERALAVGHVNTRGGAKIDKAFMAGIRKPKS